MPTDPKRQQRQTARETGTLTSRLRVTVDVPSPAEPSDAEAATRTLKARLKDAALNARLAPGLSERELRIKAKIIQRDIERFVASNRAFFIPVHSSKRWWIEQKHLEYKISCLVPAAVVKIEPNEALLKIREDFIAAISLLDERKLRTALDFVLALSDRYTDKNLTEPNSIPAEETDYLKRPRGETAPEFITRVYGRWLDGNFTRADLQRVNAAAYRGLYTHESSYGRVPLEKLNLPTDEEIFARRLASGELDDEIRQARRLLRRVERHARGTKKHGPRQ